MARHKNTVITVAHEMQLCRVQCHTIGVTDHRFEEMKTAAIELGKSGFGSSLEFLKAIVNVECKAVVEQRYAKD